MMTDFFIVPFFLTRFVSFISTEQWFQRVVCDVMEEEEIFEKKEE